MTYRPLIAAALAAALAFSAPQIGGCARKHGKYTQKHLDKKQQRVNELKSMNEYQTAHQAYLAGDLTKALLAVDRSITLNPEIAKSHVLRGRILIERGDVAGAAGALKKAEEIDPQNVEAQYYLGFVAERVSELDEAQNRYLAAAKLDPTNAQYVVAAAEMMIDRGMLDEADLYLSQQSTMLEHNAGVRQTRGHVAMLRDEPEVACMYFDEARLLAPDDTLIVEDLVRAQIATARFADAEYNLARLQKAPGYEQRRDIQHLRARCLLNVDRPMEAREILVKLTRGDEGAKDVEVWILLGNVSYLIRDERRLREVAQRVVALAPERHEGYTLSGLSHRHNGELERALEAFDKAVERRATDTQPLVLRGLLLEQLGRIDEARTSYELALQQNPEDASIAQLLASLPPRDAFVTVPDPGQ